MPFESPSTKRFVWLQAHSGPEVNQSQAICASNINHPAAAIDLFGAQFRSNGLQYCLSEVRQFLPAHSCCKFLEAVQDIEVNNWPNDPNVSGLCQNFSRPVVVDGQFSRKRRESIRMARSRARASSKPTRIVQEGRESREEAPLLEDFNDTVCLTHENCWPTASPKPKSDVSNNHQECTINRGVVLHKVSKHTLLVGRTH